MSSDLCLFAVQITTNASFFFELSFIFGYLHFFGTQVVYDDGDVERLHLKNEKWEFIDEGRDNNPDASSDMYVNKYSTLHHRYPLKVLMTFLVTSALKSFI
jgi:hypothetical protein